jgi:hypothetical protein
MALPWEQVEAVGLRTFTSDREPLVTTAERR